jgi:RNA polymerase sigma-70 factor, ECF subfamily
MSANRAMAPPVSIEAECCARYLPAARLFARRHAGAAGDDLAQEAMSVLIGAIREGRITDVAAAGPFLLGVCRNLARATERKERRRGALLELVESPDPAQGPLLDRWRLFRCLGLLSGKAREVILRSYVRGEEAEEIGAELGLTAGNVRVMRFRSLTALKTCISGEEGAR